MKLIKKLFVLIIICVLCILLYCVFRKHNKEGMNETIPKKIWTFWEGEQNDFVNRCIDSWKKHNPDCEVIVLNKTNIQEYLPKLKIDKLKHVDDIRHFSDVIRVFILAKYGGIWSDASIICYGSYDWIFELQEEKKVEFIGYWINDDNKESPIIENWFFACIPNSTLVNDWKDSLMISQKYENKDEYIDFLKTKCDLDAIESPDYLWMHSALQNILQNNKNKYKYEVFSAHDGPFKYTSENDWNASRSIDSLIKCNADSNCKEKYNSFVKLNGYIRGEVNATNENKILS